MGIRDIEISVELLKDILVKGSDVTDDLRRIKCIEGLPSDATLLHSSITKRGDLSLTFSSCEWVGGGVLAVVYSEVLQRGREPTKAPTSRDLCPFCGGKPETLNHAGWKVRCTGCGITTPDGYSEELFALD